MKTSEKRISRRTSKVGQSSSNSGSAKRVTRSAARPKRKLAAHKRSDEELPKRKTGKHVSRKNRGSSTDVVILAMSPKAANILRSLLGKARYDEPELDAIKAELDSQTR